MIPWFLASLVPGYQELLVILLLALIFFGGKKLPDLARGLGQSWNEFRKAKDEFDKEVAKTPETPAATPPDQPIVSVISKDEHKQG